MYNLVLLAALEPRFGSITSLQRVHLLFFECLRKIIWGELWETSAKFAYCVEEV